MSILARPGLAGSTEKPRHEFDRTAEVLGYDPNGETVQVKVVSAALAYDEPSTGQTRILVVHQALYVPHLVHNLLSTMQLRLNDVVVDDCPKFLTAADQLTELSHALVIPDNQNPDKPLLIPLSLHRTNSFFPTRKPTAQEFEACDAHLDITYESPEYDPSDPSFAEQEAAYRDATEGKDR